MRNPREIISVEKEKYSSDIFNERKKFKKLIIVIPITVALLTLLIMLIGFFKTKNAYEEMNSESVINELYELGNGVRDLLTDEANNLNEEIMKLEAERFQLESNKILLESDLNTLNTYGGTETQKQTITKEIEDLEKNIKDLDNEIAVMTEKRNNLLNEINKLE